MFIRVSLLKEALMNQITDSCNAHCKPGFTEKQGQYLAFIHAYTCINKRPPAEADLRRHFQVTPPSVHQMVITLERQGLITRQPGKPRSIQIRIAPENLPVLR
jgi:DNA-binding MarR family transcriptional regulator